MNPKKSKCATYFTHIDKSTFILVLNVELNTLISKSSLPLQQTSTCTAKAPDQTALQLIHKEKCAARPCCLLELV